MSKALGPTDIKRLNRQWRHRTERRIALMLCALSNPFNTGNILRSASVFGVETVYLVGATPSPNDPSVQKMAMGTNRHLDIIRIDELADGVPTAKSDGWSVVALELASSAMPVHEFIWPDATCLVIGNEAHGLSRAVLAQCDSSVYIAQPGKTESLNVATSTAIAIHEARRHEWTGS